jgi:hypothetical protein
MTQQKTKRPTQAKNGSKEERKKALTAEYRAKLDPIEAEHQAKRNSIAAEYQAKLRAIDTEGDSNEELRKYVHVQCVFCGNALTVDTISGEVISAERINEGTDVERCNGQRGGG